MNHPKLIQGGMGIGVSWWQLPRVVSMLKQLGVVSGAHADIVFVRILQLGDPGGHLRRALEHFPAQDVAERIIATYYNEGGLLAHKAFKNPPRYTLAFDQRLAELTVAANFCLVWLAKEGHDGVVGINLLETIQLPQLASIYGAMMAGVDYILMGAGIPTQISGVLDKFVNHEPAQYKVHVLGADRKDSYYVSFDPQSIWTPTTTLTRPYFFPIISSASLAKMLIRSGQIDGLVCEGSPAGGHNAPPRGQLKLTEDGQPIYGDRDKLDFEQMRQTGIPFWLAGSYATPAGMRKALEVGAQGIQAGSIFALCDESRFLPEIKAVARQLASVDGLRIFTDPQASPKGFPFKKAILAGTLTDSEKYAQRRRVCDLGRLRGPCIRSDGTLGYRCSAETVDSFLAKGGSVEDTINCICLCNALLANVGLAQRRKGGELELPFITFGDDYSWLKVLSPDGANYTARQAVDYLLSG